MDGARDKQTKNPARGLGTPGRGTATATGATPTQYSIRTPGSAQRQQGLSASGRRTTAAATPHGRAALHARDTHRLGLRRRSVRGERETPRNVLRGLSRALAAKSEAVQVSSSPRDGSGQRTGSRRSRLSTLDGLDDEDDDDDDLPIDRPRLSLPIDMEDDSDIMPHRSAGLEDENFTMQSVELPRRANFEQDARRQSAGTARISDYFAQADFQSSEVGIDSGFFPPRGTVEEEVAEEDREDVTYERFDADSGRRATGRASDFDMDVPVDGNETTFFLAPQIEDSPSRQLFEGMDEDGPDDGPLNDDNGQEDMVNEADLTDEGGREVAEENGLPTAKSHKTAAARRKADKRLKLSKHGIPYPSLPPAVVKRLAQTFAKSNGMKGKISPDTLNALMQATDWYFEQASEDLGAYATHAGRKTINESDVVTLMKRQRLITSTSTLFSLAQRHLPRELLQELRMPPPSPPPAARKKRDGRSGVGSRQ